MRGAEARMRESLPFPSYDERHEVGNMRENVVAYLERMDGDEDVLDPRCGCKWVYVVSSYQFL